MHFSDRIPHRLAVLITAFVFCLSACAPKSDLFAYTKGDAEFTMIFPSVSGDTESITCACTRSFSPDDTADFTLTVTSPPRLAGFTVTRTDGNTSAGYGETMIPLSPESAENLTRIFDALTETGSAKKSPDGAHTVILAPSGTVTLDEALNPIELEIPGTSVRIQWPVRDP